MVDVWLKSVYNWILSDFNQHKTRFVLEVLAWFLSIGCSVTMAMTVPTPPLLSIYPVWITGCLIFAWSAWERKSFGMLANYILLATIDMYGLSRMLMQ